MKKKILLTLGIVLALATTATSVAYFTSKENKVNPFTIGSIETEIDEHGFKQDGDNILNQEIEKKVSVRNIGKNPVLLRVIINPQWDEERDENGKVTKLTTSASNQVQLNFSNDIDEHWIKGNDGYYYYNKVLEPAKRDNKGNIIKETDGKDETKLLLKSVSLKDIPNEEKEEYKNRKLTVNVSSEAIQVNEQALEDEWNSNNTMGEVASRLKGIIKAYNKK